MGFRTIPFNGYLTITHFNSATAEDGVVDFSNYGSEDDSQVADGFQVQRDLMHLNSKGKIGYWNQQDKEITIVDLTPEILDEIQKAKNESTYLIGLKNRAEPREPVNLDEVTVNRNNDYGPTINIGCFNEGTYRQCKELSRIPCYLASEKCPICGGKTDSFQNFLKMIDHASQADLWQSHIWETIGGRSTNITFSVKTAEVRVINLKELFLQEGDKVSYINLTPFHEGERLPQIRPLLPERSIEQANANQFLQVYGWTELKNLQNNTTEQIGINGYFIWLPKDRIEEFYQLHLAIRSFYDQFYDAAIIFAHTSFEYHSNKLKRPIKTSMGICSEEWDELWEHAKEKNTPHWKFVLDLTTNFLGLSSIDNFSPSLRETIIKLKRNRNDLAHTGILRNSVSREDIFNQVCSAIFISHLCRSIAAILTNENEKIKFVEVMAEYSSTNIIEGQPDCMQSRYSPVLPD